MNNWKSKIKEEWLKIEVERLEEKLNKLLKKSEEFTNEALEVEIANKCKEINWWKNLVLNT
jgi:hypothetical protein